MPNSNISLDRLGLQVPTMTFQDGSRLVTRPITDHPPIIQNTLWGAIGTINILHPGSALAPPAQINGVKNLPSDGKVQMELMAEYIFKMFQQGVGVLALQELPDPNSQNFKFLKSKLKRLVGSSNLIDVDALEDQWLKTGTHAFGTSILFNPNLFKISKNARPDLHNRAAVYELIAANGTRIPVANIHGDFRTQKETQDYLSHFDGLCLGDLNISRHSISAGSDSNILQSIAIPHVEIEGVRREINTVDAIQDTYSKKANPSFTPDMNRIPLMTVTPMVQKPTFHPIVISIEADKAKKWLQDFSAYLSIAKSYLIDKGAITGIKLKTPPPYTTAQITIDNEEVYQSYLKFAQFELNKKKTQEEFIKSLDELRSKLESHSSSGTRSRQKGEDLYKTLFEAQKIFFSQLSPASDSTKINRSLTNFRKICEQNVKDADKIMGHGWLYRTAEILIKAIVGLFAAIGMTVGVIAGQGLLKSEHRQAFKNTFFTFNQTDSTKALNTFKQKVLGEDEKDQGLLDEKNISPKKN